MALTIDDDRPNKPHDARYTKRLKRQDIWLWLYFMIIYKVDFDRNTCNSELMRDLVAKTLESRLGVKRQLETLKLQFLVAESHFRWISDDERQTAWILSEIRELEDIFVPRGLPHLAGRDLIIGTLDIWDREIDFKGQEIVRLHEKWRRHIARDSEFEWFADKKEGTKRCVCAWTWLEKNHLRPYSRELPISNYGELLMFFDMAKLGYNEQKAIIQEVKKRWNRQQFDERNAHKKQVNVMLAIAAIDQLDELTRQHAIKRGQVIETLLRMEAENGLYIEMAKTDKRSNLKAPI